MTNYELISILVSIRHAGNLLPTPQVQLYVVNIIVCLFILCNLCLYASASEQQAGEVNFLFILNNFLNVIKHLSMPPKEGIGENKA